MDSSSVPMVDMLEPSSSWLPPPENIFLESYLTPLHSSSSSFGHLRVYWSHDDDPQFIQDKIKCAFQNFPVDFSHIYCLFQFWAPVKIDGRRLLTTSNQPFALPEKINNYKELGEHRLCSVKYEYNVDLNKVGVEEDPTNTIITDGPPASAFLNHIPELLPDLTVHLNKNPLLSSASKRGLEYSVVLPVFDPSQGGDCVGVVECFTFLGDDLIHTFNKLNIALENQGLKTFDAQQHLPYQRRCGLQNAREEIDEALEIILQAHGLALSQVFIPYEYENQVAFSSSLQDTPTKQMLWLKLTSHSWEAFFDEYDFGYLEEYNGAHYRLPMKVDAMFAGNTLENYEPLFIQDISELNYDNPKWLVLRIQEFSCSCFVICLRNTRTGDLDYVFEFFWRNHKQRNNVILLEQLFLTLKRYLPSFEFASGTDFGDAIDILDVNNSKGSEKKHIKIFQRNKVSLKRGWQSKVEECSTILKAIHNTKEKKLSREQIELQFGKTLEEAAAKLNVSVSTLKRYCTRLEIKWHGKDRSKRNVKHSYKNQSNTNEEEDQGGAIQDPSSAIIRKTSVDESTLTIKVEYKGDLIKFTLPISSATYEAIQEEIVNQFELGCAAHYKLKYLDDENEWILFKRDEDVRLCTKNKRNIRLHLLQRDPSGSRDRLGGYLG